MYAIYSHVHPWHSIGPGSTSSCILGPVDIAIYLIWCDAASAFVPVTNSVKYMYRIARIAVRT